MKVQIEEVDIDTLHSFKKNSTTHSPKQIRQIANSYEQFGFLGAIIISEENEILAGSGRVAAARLLGMRTIPCIRNSSMTAAQKRAFALADNKIQRNAGVDLEILAIELAELAELGIVMPDLGFEQYEIDQILIDADASSPKRKRSRDDVCPDIPATATTRPGDLWNLGRHRLWCGDAADSEGVGRLMGADRARMMFADPPYNVALSGHASGLGSIKHREFVQANGDLSPEEFTSWLVRAFSPSARLCVDGAIAFTCMDWRHLAEMSAAGSQVFTEPKNLCVWVKTPGMGAFYRSSHELVFAWKIGTAPHINTFELGQHGRSRTNVWNYPGMASFGANRMEDLARHPTPKNLQMVIDAILDVSHRGDIVLDPFGGSGTTLIAAHKCGRIARLVEIDPLYCDVIIERFRKVTGKVATLETSGLDFDAVAAIRASGSDLAINSPTQQVSSPPSTSAWVAPLPSGWGTPTSLAGSAVIWTIASKNCASAQK